MKDNQYPVLENVVQASNGALNRVGQGQGGAARRCKEVGRQGYGGQVVGAGGQVGRQELWRHAVGAGGQGPPGLGHVAALPAAPAGWACGP